MAREREEADKMVDKQLRTLLDKHGADLPLQALARIICENEHMPQHDDVLGLAELIVNTFDHGSLAEAVEYCCIYNWAGLVLAYIEGHLI
jgi:hypothetical protein